MTSPPSDALEGGCLCGAVRFSLTPPTDFVAHCHCQSCRRAHVSYEERVPWLSFKDGLPKHRGKSDETLKG